MFFNILIYGIYRSIQEKKNMFPSVINKIDFKSSFLADILNVRNSKYDLEDK